MPRINFDKLTANTPAESSNIIKKRVQAAREIQQERFKGAPFLSNAEMTSAAIKTFCPVDNAAKQLLKNAVEQMHLSARSYFRILKLARTIADLSREKEIATTCVAEALQYRPKLSL